MNSSTALPTSSPEAYALLEGQPYKADKKGKRRVSAILREDGL